MCAFICCRLTTYAGLILIVRTSKTFRSKTLGETHGNSSGIYETCKTHDSVQNPSTTKTRYTDNKNLPLIYKSRFTLYKTLGKEKNTLSPRIARHANTRSYLHKLHRQRELLDGGGEVLQLVEAQVEGFLVPTLGFSLASPFTRLLRISCPRKKNTTSLRFFSTRNHAFFAFIMFVFFVTFAFQLNTPSTKYGSCNPWPTITGDHS